MRKNAMGKPMKRFAVMAAAVCAVSLAAPPAIAQETLVPETPEPRRYTVEVIIFEYAEQVSVGTELFEPDPPPEVDPAEPPPEFVFEDIPPEPAAEAPAAEEIVVEEEDTPQGPEFILHIEDEFSLLNVADRLELLDVYEPLMHFAWTQATLPEEETIAIDLPSLAETPERMSGSFKLYLSRYLHLVVDLTLDELHANGEPVAIDESTIVYSDNRFGTSYTDVPPDPVRFRIQEDRIFKNGDLRYFDHPKFGVLAKITRVEEPEEEPIEPEMLGDGPADLVSGVSE